MPESFKALIERVACRDPENAFAALNVKVKARRDLVTATWRTRE
jgi:hypothetical protein